MAAQGGAKAQKQRERSENIIASLENEYANGITMEQMFPLFLEYQFPDSIKKIQKVMAIREELMANPHSMKSWQEVAMMDIIQAEGYLKIQFAGKETLNGNDAVKNFKDDKWMMNMDEDTSDGLNKFLELKYGKELFSDEIEPEMEKDLNDLKQLESEEEELQKDSDPEQHSKPNDSNDSPM